MSNSDPCFDGVYGQILQATRRGEMLPFTGAGVSIPKPSSLASGAALTQPLLDGLWESVRRFRDIGRVSPEQIGEQYEEMKAWRLERVLDALQSTHGPRALQFLEVLNRTSWNRNHSAVVALAKSGYLKRCVTLNFDRLFELAAAKAELSCSTACPTASISRFPTNGNACAFEVVKLHGSFLPTELSHDPFAILGATISRVGVKPDGRNVRLLRSAFRESPVLLVAGYSDNDWDIFPIFAHLSRRIKHIFWVFYVPDNHVANQRLPQPDPVFEKLVRLNRDFGVNVTVIFADPINLLTRLLTDCKIEKPKKCPNEDPRSRTPDPSFLLDGEHAVNKTRVAMAMLSRQDFQVPLLKWLLTQDAIRSNMPLFMHVKDLWGHDLHTRGQIMDAIEETKDVLRMKMWLNCKESELLSSRLWLAYEYLCLVKRPHSPFLLWLARSPSYFTKGWFMAKKVEREAGDNRQKEALATYYRLDLIHSWLSSTMLLGPLSHILFGTLFRVVARNYKRVMEKSDTLGYEYYYLRYLEAYVMGFRRTPQEYGEVMRKISEIEGMYGLLQNRVQMGNPAAYRALIIFCCGPGSRSERRRRARRELRRAEDLWKRNSDSISAAETRCRLFRWYIEFSWKHFSTLLRQVFRRIHRE